MTWLSKLVLVAMVAAFTIVAASSCSSAMAQTEEELAAGFTERQPSHLTNLYLPDGGTGVCQQTNIIGNNCHDPNGFPTACCLVIFPPSTEPVGPGCVVYAPTLVAIQQVGKGFCCELMYPGSGSDDWRRYEDSTKACDFCGGKTPGPNECCSRDRDIVQKYPIDGPLEKCPERSQEPNHPPSFNGCGPKGKPFFSKVLPQRFGPVSFVDNCNGHDVCYSTCRNDKATCDSRFGAGLAEACHAYFDPPIEQLARAGELEAARELNIGRVNCLRMAETYEDAVADRLPGSSHGGADAFEAAQREVCQCCP